MPRTPQNQSAVNPGRCRCSWGSRGGKGVLNLRQSKYRVSAPLSSTCRANPMLISLRAPPATFRAESRLEAWRAAVSVRAEPWQKRTLCPPCGATAWQLKRRSRLTPRSAGTCRHVSMLRACAAPHSFSFARLEPAWRRLRSRPAVLALTRAVRLQRIAVSLRSASGARSTPRDRQRQCESRRARNARPAR